MNDSFCCTSCLSGYKQKYSGKIESIKGKFEEGKRVDPDNGYDLIRYFLA
jgi:hypothetical protein